MNAREKFYSDIERIKKHDRADNAGQYNGIRASRAVAELFEKQDRTLQSLSNSIASYWLSTYILNGDPQTEPTEEHVTWICDALDLILNQLDGDPCFTREDWEELRDMINDEAGDLDLDLLTSLLGAVMDHGAL